MKHKGLKHEYWQSKIARSEGVHSPFCNGVPLMALEMAILGISFTHSFKKYSLRMLSTADR